MIQSSKPLRFRATLLFSWSLQLANTHYILHWLLNQFSQGVTILCLLEICSLNSLYSCSFPRSNSTLFLTTVATSSHTHKTVFLISSPPQVLITFCSVFLLCTIQTCSPEGKDCITLYSAAEQRRSWQAENTQLFNLSWRLYCLEISLYLLCISLIWNFTTTVNVISLPFPLAFQ